MKRWLLIGSIVLVVMVVGSAAFLMSKKQSTQNTASKRHSLPSLIDAKTLSSLEHRTASNIDNSRLSEAAIKSPPTNKWYSGMVLNTQPQPGFALPLSVLPKEDGVEVGLPQITTTGDGIYGPHVNGIQVTASDVAGYSLTRFDELTITLTYHDDARQPLFTITFSAGSPYGFISVERATTIAIQSGKLHTNSQGLSVYEHHNAYYGLWSSNKKNGPAIKVKHGDSLAVFAGVDNVDIQSLATYANTPILSGDVSYSIHDATVRTTLSYKTKYNKPTVVTRMPHQQLSDRNKKVAAYDTLYGKLSAYRANTITYEIPNTPIRWRLPLKGVSPSQKTAVATQLNIDIANTKLSKADTYFGGKELQRLAQLVMVADSIGQSKERRTALAKLHHALDGWFDSNSDRSFYYDSTAKAIVGVESSFGSNTELNDHHFHYGYFIYAAAVAAKFDKDFLKAHKDVVNLIVADIANYNLDESLPLRRVYDPYAGHSWASGLANYSDGNNQESVSEAINAWTAVGLWAEVSDNKALYTEAEWLLSNEIIAAKTYWLKKPNNAQYTSPLVSINWGGKREYRTFFSDEANAKLAIQLLPLNPSMADYATTIPSSIFTGTDLAKQYGDYVLMAQGANNTFEAVKRYPNSRIDDGNSKTYMLVHALSSRR